jgi:signal transduction histidine kinase
MIDDLLDVTRIANGKIIFNPIVLDAHQALKDVQFNLKERIDGKHIKLRENVGEFSMNSPGIFQEIARISHQIMTRCYRL